MSAVGSGLALAPEMSLEQLAAEIRHEHEGCLLAAVSSLHHAIRAGEALLAARAQVPRGQWEPWLDANCPDVQRMSKQYMRIATYKDMLGPEVRTAIEAEHALRGLPGFDGSGPQRHPESTRQRALELASEGVPKAMIARMLGIDRKCIRRWMDGRDEPARAGSYRMGRPTRADQKRHEQIVASTPAKTAIGPLALANSFRSVVEANRRGATLELVEALRLLAEAALGWARQLEKAKHREAA